MPVVLLHQLDGTAGIALGAIQRAAGYSYLDGTAAPVHRGEHHLVRAGVAGEGAADQRAQLLGSCFTNEIMPFRPTLVASIHHEFEVEVHEAFDHIVLRLSGQLSLRTVALVREAAVKSLLGAGRVVIDVSQLHPTQASLVSVFPAALAASGGWPSARLVLFGADARLRGMLVSTRVTRTVPLAANLTSALDTLEQLPPEVRCHRSLPMHATAVAAARLFLREACDAWLVPPGVCEVAELLSSELVTNAVEHAHSTSELTVTRTGSVLRISVRDYRPGRLPRPRPIEVNAPRGRGLHLVAALAQTWGVEAHPNGKTVWVSLLLLGEDESLKLLRPPPPI